jgi:hypothetical protein
VCLSHKVLVRVLIFLVAASVLGSAFHFNQRSLLRADPPAGLGLGIAHGALMPLALPSLLLARNVEIYAPDNTGRAYKLGYTMGVNGCGLIFFGVLFRRVSRWRKGRPGGPN